MSDQIKTVQQITVLFPPDKSGWYDTDSGQLYWFLKERLWSCRSDHVSEEYPKYWYKEIPTTEKAKRRIKVKRLKEAVNTLKHYGFISEFEKDSFLMRIETVTNPEKCANKRKLK